MDKEESERQSSILSLQRTHLSRYSSIKVLQMLQCFTQAVIMAAMAYSLLYFIITVKLKSFEIAGRLVSVRVH